MRSLTYAKHSGFTLIEVIIAMSIFAILAVLSYTGLQSVINSKTNTEGSLNRLQELQMAVHTLSTDMLQLSARQAHDSLGGNLLPLSTQDTDLLVDFTRSGWSNPANLTRSTLQRVAYYIDEDNLIRVYWPHIDRADDESRIERTLISNIDTLELRFLDEKQQWQTDWPVADALASAQPAALPLAVEITLKMNDWGEIKRLIRVAL